MRLLISIFCCFSSLMSSSFSLPTLKTESYTVDFNGASGGFKLISNSDNIFYNMRYGWLTETPNNKLNLNFQNFDYGSNENITFVNTNLSDGPFQITIKNEIWKKSSQFINEKNQTMIVDKDSMKLTISMSGWEFLSSNNFLTLDFSISNNIGNSINNIDNTTIKVREFDFYFEPNVIVDNVEKTISFYTSGNKYYLQFPYFSTDLFYDPTITYINNWNGSNTLSYSKYQIIFLCLILTIHLYYF